MKHSFKWTVLYSSVLILSICAELKATNPFVNAFEISDQDTGQPPAKRHKLNSHQAVGLSSVNDVKVEIVVSSHSFCDLPQPAIELILQYANNQAYQINRQFFKIATGYDSSDLESVKKLGWPTEYKWSNIIHHYKNYKINFYNEGSNDLIQRTPSFILSSMVHSVRGDPGNYWGRLKFTNIRNFDLAVDCSQSTDQCGEELGCALQPSKINTIRIAKGLLRPKDLLTVLNKLRTGQLNNLNIEHNSYTQDQFDCIVGHLIRLQTSILDLSHVSIQDNSLNDAIKRLAKTEIKKLRIESIKFGSQSEAVEFFSLISATQIKNLSISHTDLRSIVDFQQLFNRLSLTHLDLSYCKISGDQAVDIASAIKTKSMSHLDLSNNNITNPCVQRLADMFKATKVREVNLSYNKFCQRFADIYLHPLDNQIVWILDGLHNNIFQDSSIKWH